jgi:hypothetical protein
MGKSRFKTVRFSDYNKSEMIMSSDYKKCEVCGAYGWTEGARKHKCKPFYKFKHEDYGDEWEDIRGLDHEDAALAFAEKHNADDYCLMNNETVVEIKGNDDDGNEVVFRFCVGAEPEISYSASEVD